jgi:excisionase family DNA binding protein
MLTIREVCELYQVSKSTVERAIRSAHDPLPVIRFGTGRRVHPRELKRWLRRRSALVKAP